MKASRRREMLLGAIGSYTKANPDAMRVHWLTAQIQAYSWAEEALREADHLEAAQLVKGIVGRTRADLANTLAGPAG